MAETALTPRAEIRAWPHINLGDRSISEGNYSLQSLPRRSECQASMRSNDRSDNRFETDWMPPESASVLNALSRLSGRPLPRRLGAFGSFRVFRVRLRRGR